MAHYVTLMKWTSQGRMGLPAWRDRVEDGQRMIEEAGGKLVGVWVTLGQYDVVEVFLAHPLARVHADDAKHLRSDAHELVRCVSRCDENIAGPRLDSLPVDREGRLPVQIGRAHV